MLPLATGKQYYSHWGSIKQNVHLFLDLDGNPTLDYPHVHVIHFKNGLVKVEVSLGKRDHPWKKEFNNPSGQEVEQAIDEARTHLVERKIGLVGEQG